ncbi:hypothetical protein QYE76_040402 [Lolium multiflorum]|uniref:Uncharacterized protein n=1 Tax=Lolium multiflorum TaxID=4521 RepID=A0AAD8TBI0_LOLMU|nr:hypothetical protein QYE76_040402 [Lolium multiflorum]
MNFLLFLLQLLAISLPCIPIAVAELVYDIEGKELSSKGNYYILPAKHLSGGGLTTSPSGWLCLHFVLQERNTTLLGTPMRFTPLPWRRSTKEPIRLSSDIWIEFHDLDSFCATRLDWHLTDRLPQTLSGRRQLLGAGNEDGGRSFGVFRIEKNGANVTGYKLMACAKKESCNDLGLYASKDKTWLAVSDEPLMVVFVRQTSYY